MTYHCIESTYEFTCRGYQVRLWCDEKKVHRTSEVACEMLIVYLQTFVVPPAPHTLIEFAQEHVPHLNAIQVRWKGPPPPGQVWDVWSGIMVYLVPFTESEHHG